MNLSTKIRRQTRESCHCFFVKNRSYHKKCTLTNSQDSTSFLHENAVTIRGQILTAQRATSSSLSTAIAMGFAKSRTVHTFILKLHSLKNLIVNCYEDGGKDKLWKRVLQNKKFCCQSTIY